MRTRLASLDPRVLILAAISFISSLGIGVMVPLIPLYAVSLGASPVQLGLLTSAFALANAAAQLGGGLLTDRLGPLRLIRSGLLLYGLANVLIATATSAAMLIAYRAFAGVGVGISFIATRLYLAQIADPARMALANGILSAAYSAGQVVGPAFGGIVTTMAGLRAPFLIVGGTSGVAYLPSLALRGEMRQARAPEPQVVSGVGLLLSGALVVLTAAQFFVLAGFGGFITAYAPFATQVLGWSMLEVGVIFSVFGAGSVLLGPGISHLADRMGRRRVAAASCIPAAVFGLAMVLAWPRWTIYGTAFVAGGGITAFTAAWFAMVREASPEARRGKIFGTTNALSQLGMIAGAMAASAVWQQVGLGPAILVPSAAMLLAAGTLLLRRGSAEIG